MQYLQRQFKIINKIKLLEEKARIVELEAEKEAEIFRLHREVNRAKARALMFEVCTKDDQTLEIKISIIEDERKDEELHDLKE